MTKHIMLIACHGAVYNKHSEEQRGNIILNLPQMQIPIEISTFAQQGCVHWTDVQIDKVMDHIQNMSGDLTTAFGNYEHERVPGGFKSTWPEVSSLRITDQPPGHPSAAPAKTFCSSIRFPNMGFTDYNSKEEAEARKPVRFADEVLSPGISIFDTGLDSHAQRTIFEKSISGIREMINSGLEHRSDFSTFDRVKYPDGDGSFVDSVNLDHIILYLLPTIYSNPTKYFLQKSTIPTSFEIIIASCIGANLVDTVLQNVWEGLTWPRTDPSVERLNYNDIARGCERQPRSLVPPDTGLNREALRSFRDEQDPYTRGGRKKIKNTKKVGKKKYSKKKRGKKQTKRKRGKKRKKTKK